jgi:dephospho-CoA kinase
MLKIGLTGGIGSGKSVVCDVFRTLGVPVYVADNEAKRLMQSDPVIVRSIKDLLGERSFQDGVLNREYIGEYVFKDSEKLAQLNAIVHPAVHDDFERWIRTLEGEPYVIEEAALLFESGGAARMNHTIFVRAALETRVKRVVSRDKVTEERVMDRIRNQMDDEKKEKLADFVIINEIDSMILPQIIDLHHKFLKINR